MKPTAAASSGTCPRCGGVFRCGAGDPEPCPCTTQPLSPALALQLRQQFSGCLCLACLAALAAAEPVSATG